MGGGSRGALHAPRSRKKPRQRLQRPSPNTGNHAGPQDKELEPGWEISSEKKPGKGTKTEAGKKRWGETGGGPAHPTRELAGASKCLERGCLLRSEFPRNSGVGCPFPRKPTWLPSSDGTLRGSKETPLGWLPTKL